MTSGGDDLSARHRHLLALSAIQRRQLGQVAAEIDGRLARVDRGIALVRRLLRHPLAITGGLALVIWVGPRRLLRWGKRALVLYFTSRRLTRGARG
ncbi:MAG: YqjK-like family protein [Proteobacteria bacterium]|nr:YqjK-like family protein [Pseudomonadota bacterium]